MEILLSRVQIYIPTIQDLLSCDWNRNDSLFPETESHSVVSDSLQPHGLYSPWNSPGQNTGVGSLSLLQRIFPTQRSNSGQILYHLNHKGSPRILECVAYPFSTGSSQPRNETRVTCIAGRFFTNLVNREALRRVQNSCFYKT